MMRLSAGYLLLLAGIARAESQYLVNELSFGHGPRYAQLVFPVCVTKDRLLIHRRPTLQDSSRGVTIDPQLLHPGPALRP